MIPFSVLMSIYRKEQPEYFIAALNSIIDQTVKPNEIVIIKDGKLTSILDQIIDTYSLLHPGLFKIITLNENQGLGSALQIGIKQCSHDIIARMDTDDISCKERFEKQIIIFEESKKEIDIVGAYIDEFEEDVTKILSTRKVPISNDEIYNGAKKRNPFNHMTVMFRKQTVLNAGNYQPFLWNEDYFLWVRMILNQAKMSNIPQSLVYVRTGKLMFERRGGIRYALSEIKLQIQFLRMGFISIFNAVLNIFVRTVVRLLPNKIRRYIYISFLR